MPESRVVLSDQTFLFGPSAASDRVATEFATRGWSRALLFASVSAMRSGLRDWVRDVALRGCQTHLVNDAISGHSPIQETEAIAGRLVGIEADVIVVVGGGSVSDTAKGVAILLAEGGDLERHCSVFRPPDQFEHRELTAPKLPIVAVPTTLSGAEVTPGGGATNASGTKRTFWDPRVAARVVAFDPTVLAAVPRDVLVSTGMNGLAHCAEGLYSRTANPISTSLAVSGARDLAWGLRRLAAGEAGVDVMDSLGAGAAAGGLVISNARVGLHHAVCHVLGGRYGLPHGVANSVMLPHVLRYNLPVTHAAQQALADALGGDTDQQGPEAVEALQREIGAPHRLRDHGINTDDFEDIAKDTMQDRGLYFNPRVVPDPDTVVRLLEHAY